MAKLYCKHCKRIINTDMRSKINKKNMTKRGYKSFCEKTGKRVFMVPYQESKG
jgi:hypothetical protein